MIHFQEECTDVLEAHFAAKHDGATLIAPPTSVAQTVPITASPDAHALAEQIDALAGVMNLLREHLAGLLSLPNKVDGVAEQIQRVIGFLEALTGQQTTLINRQDVAESQIAQIDERTQRLTPAHTRDVKDFVDRMVRETRRLPTPLTYFIVYGRLKHRFRVATYKEIVDDLFADVMTYLQEELRQMLDGEQPAQGILF